ncbi:hypothetical protein GF342_03155 [Candidatus Woesearchaeota archaeon]|nr:hypothetical protein [Candidatus Woesearchaeota archaeon]
MSEALVRLRSVEEYSRPGYEFVYLCLCSKRPVELFGSSRRAKVFGMAVPDAVYAKKRLEFDRFSCGMHHFLFYDEPAFLKGAGSSDRLARLRDMNMADDSLESEVMKMRQSFRIVRNGQLQFTTGWLRDSQRITLLKRLHQVPPVGVVGGLHEREIRCDIGMVYSTVCGSCSGSIIELLNVDTALQNISLRSYRICFE